MHETTITADVTFANGTTATVKAKVIWIRGATRAMIKHRLRTLAEQESGQRVDSITITGEN
jgi:hypothetical protein